MSMAHNLKQIKQKDKDIVYGYLKKMERTLLSMNQSIPQPIMVLCLLYYVFIEKFDQFTNSVNVVNDVTVQWRCDQQVTVYGIYDIINKFNACISWTFQILSDPLFKIGFGIDNTILKRRNEVWWSSHGVNHQNAGVNLYSITTSNGINEQGKRISIQKETRIKSSLMISGYHRADFKINDKIKMELNTKKQTLIFYKNDEQFQEFKDIELDTFMPYNMFVAAENANVKIKLIDFKIMKLK